MLTVSVVIPCKNEEQYIGNCVTSFLNQDYPGELLSIHVVDGLSNDGTVEVVKELASEHGNVHLLINKMQTTPNALNLGILNSETDVVIIFGAHAVADKSYVTECVKVLERYTDVGCAGGIIENVHENKTAQVISGAMASPVGVGNAHFRTGSKTGYVDTVAFGAYRREVFETAGLFDETLTRNQDDEFNFRLLKNGFKIFLEPTIKSRYYVRGSISKLFKQYYQYGFWKVVVNKKHNTITTIRQLAPLCFVLLLIIGAVASAIWPWAAWYYLAGLTCYFIILLVESIRKNPKQVVWSVVIFLVLHLAYGLGYLWALITVPFMRTSKIKANSSLSR